jgi:putative membrane protein
MAKDASLNTSMDSAQKHYSSMFFLPSYRKSLMAIAIICILGVSICSFSLFPSLTSFLLGVSLFALTITADSVTSEFVLKSDQLFIPRRILAMSFYGWLLWFAFLTLGVVLGYFFDALLWVVKLSLLGFAAVVTLRIIVFAAVSYAAKGRQILAMLLQPVMCSLVFLVFWQKEVPEFPAVIVQIALFLVLAPLFAYAAMSIFLSTIDRFGKTVYSLPGLRLFRAFMLNWVTDANEPLEKQLEEMGENADIKVKLLKFDAANPKTAIIVPHVHPGPFKNIGSSLLPSLLKKRYDTAYNCDSCVPLGLLGHELDLASQPQNHRIIEEVVAHAKSEAKDTLASLMVRATDGAALACCQIFGDTAFLSFSLAPQTTEDLPQELGRIVTEEAKKHGLKNALVVNTHNCINKVVDTELHLSELERVAALSLQKAVSSPKKPFKVGSATVYPVEFTLKAGMGTGGITAIVVEVEKQKTAYVVIDGNNMIPHLREKILDSLKELEFDAGEVFTTDSHAVSALVTGRRGYHPVGEVMDHATLIRYIGEAAKKAEANLETCKAQHIEFIVPQVRVIGEKRLESVTALVDKGMQKAKRIVFPIFGTEGVLLILLLLFF